MRRKKEAMMVTKFTVHVELDYLGVDELEQEEIRSTLALIAEEFSALSAATTTIDISIEEVE